MLTQDHRKTRKGRIKKLVAIPDIKKIKAFSFSLAKKAGKIMRREFARKATSTWKADNTPITVADQKINDFVARAIKRVYPTHDLVMEEGGSLRQGSKMLWICDPIDGTIPFSHGVATAVFSLAFVIDGKVEFGLIYDPFHDKIYHATRKSGAYVNRKHIHVSKKKDLKNSVIGFTAWKNTKYYNTPKLLKLLNKEGVKSLSLGSILHMAALVAEGHFVGIISPHENLYDVAAVAILVEEAGGTVTNIKGKDTRYDAPVYGQIATNGIVHKKLLSLIKEAGH